MAYQKIVVNTNVALSVIASDTIDIPSLPSTQRITGVGNAVISSSTTAANTLECIDAAGNFEGTTIPRPVLVTDTIRNTTANTNANITAVASTILTISANIFTTAAGGENYVVLRSNVLIDISKNFLTLGVQVGDVVYNTTNSTQALVTEVAGSQLTLDADIFGSFATFNDTYTVFVSSSKGTGLSTMQSADCCLLYIGSSSVIKQDITAIAAGTNDPRYVNIRVLTCSGDDVTFTNFLVGEYLPLQVRRIFATGTTEEARNNCLAIW